MEELKELEVNARKHADALNASCLKETHKQSVVNVYEHKRYNVGTLLSFLVHIQVGKSFRWEGNNRKTGDIRRESIFCGLYWADGPGIFDALISNKCLIKRLFQQYAWKIFFHTYYIPSWINLPCKLCIFGLILINKIKIYSKAVTYLHFTWTRQEMHMQNKIITCVSEHHDHAPS